jgi:hypothetical protein
MAEPGACLFDHAPASMAKAGIDTEYAKGFGHRRRKTTIRVNRLFLFS